MSPGSGMWHLLLLEQARMPCASLSCLPLEHHCRMQRTCGSGTCPGAASHRSMMHSPLPSSHLMSKSLTHLRTPLLLLLLLKHLAPVPAPGHACAHSSSLLVHPVQRPSLLPGPTGSSG
uniref:Uncharacterized protein n=1 Tax=Arundo donax TaxID=35708 RepID=A0A0A8XQ49_ARUDO